ncbi:MAG: RecX family transcriptional regulator [Eubacteriales bacterium]|nr:RecX family transcriptional regulator [Eubacteriales bacterium]
MTDTVTDIVKRTGCRLIHLISGDRMTVPLLVFKRAPLKVGQAVDPEVYRAGTKPMEAGLALEQAGRMLISRDHTQGEIRKKLIEVGYSEPAVKQTMEKLVQARLVDDRRYVTNYVNMKIKRVGVGRIHRELTLKGIPAEDIAEALEKTDNSAQLDSAVKHAKKALSKRTKEPRHQAQLAYAALARRGYSPDVIRRALDLARDSLLEQETDGFSG